MTTIGADIETGGTGYTLISGSDCLTNGVHLSMNTRLDRLRSVCLLPERKRQFGQPPLHPIRFVRHKGAKGRVKLAATKRTVNFSS
jgi:hypothetical protein